MIIVTCFKIRMTFVRVIYIKQSQMKKTGYSPLNVNATTHSWSFTSNIFSFSWLENIIIASPCSFFSPWPGNCFNRNVTLTIWLNFEICKIITKYTGLGFFCNLTLRSKSCRNHARKQWWNTVIPYFKKFSNPNELLEYKKKSILIFDHIVFFSETFVSTLWSHLHLFYGFHFRLHIFLLL